MSDRRSTGRYEISRSCSGLPTSFQRLLLADVWVPEDEIPDFVGRLLDPRTTHGICESCMRKLEETGASRPRSQ